VDTAFRPCPALGVGPDNRPMPENSAFLSRDDEVYSMSDEECRRLLATRTFGRVGVTSGGLPVILPVRYLYDESAITFRTGTGTKLRAAEQGDVLAFEVDAYDDETKTGWSVLVLGRASVLTTEHEHAGVPTLDPGDSQGPNNHYVRLFCELVTGRRIAPTIGG
jgi:nitroimidazol reductase NimA-like FMN-containing flavoprotein (pyridoxamine 5'-phosphate oxidase superfamily)